MILKDLMLIYFETGFMNASVETDMAVATFLYTGTTTVSYMELLHNTKKDSINTLFGCKCYY